MINWFEKNKKVSWVITIIILLGIFFVSSLTFESSGAGGGKNYKATIYHIAVFFLLALFLSISLIGGEYKRKNFIFIAIVFSLLYGISDELHQYFVPGRYLSIKDFMLNSIGITIASLLYAVRLRFVKPV